MDDNYNTIVHDVERLVSVRYSVEVPLLVFPIASLEKIYSYTTEDEAEEFFFRRSKAEAEVLLEREVKNLKGTLTLDGDSWEDTKSKLIETYMRCIIESGYFNNEYEKYKELPFFIKWFTPAPVKLTREEYKKIDSHPWEENYGDYLERLRESLNKNEGQ
jgi:hypothetical protein